jgi:hypothetical protein
MRIIARLSILVLTFAMGVGAVAIVSWGSFWSEIPDIVVAEEFAYGEETKMAATPDGVRVMFAGIQPARVNENAYVRFIV